ncbi:MAG: dephospho-CoA kinase [Chloroflexi bacterium]|nr:dephospho-CoA kinase [Chloroflexota bacterium]|tara:strand:+ start:8285 stop:8875 length:591 start_codon:yes stop_codon:yes gene_type:complete
MFVIGLTGGIGTGKTLVSNILSSLGASLINADKIGHKIYEPNSDGWIEVIKTFGKEILNENQEIDRKKLGSIVFKDKKYLDQLNSITHPRIYSEIESELEINSNNGVKVSVVEAALLIEANWTSIANQVWITVAKENTIYNRLETRDGLNIEAIKSRISSQMPSKEKLKFADVIIENDSSIKDLETKVKYYWKKIK